MKISVIVHPNAKKPRVEKDLLGTLHLYVHAPPLEGKANRAAIDVLAEYFHTKRAKITLLSGEKSRSKIFEVGK
jgi:uncharacterized protein (TIGR00251 family)